MRTFIYFLIIAAVSFYGSAPAKAQQCDHALPAPPSVDLPETAALNGHHVVPVLPIPGSSVVDKSQYVVYHLQEEYPADMAVADIAYSTTNDWTHKTIVRYQQYVHGVPLAGHRILYTYDLLGRLKSYDVDLLLDAVILQELAIQVEQLPSLADYTIVSEEGEYILLHLPSSSAQPQCTFQQSTASIDLSFPEHACEQNSNLIKVQEQQLAGLGFLGEDGNYLCGKYANAVNNSYTLAQYKKDTYHNAGIPQLKEAMCYYFLNATYDYLEQKVQLIAQDLDYGNQNVAWHIPVDVLFESDLTDMENHFLISFTDNLKTINFIHNASMPNVDCTDRIDLSEDADFIVAAAVEQYFRLSGIQVPAAGVGGIGNSEGMFQGVVGFINWQMRRNFLESTKLGVYATKVDFGFDIIDLGLPSDMTYSDHVKGIKSQRDNGSLFATTLREIYEILPGDEEERTSLMYRLIFQNTVRWGTGTNAFEAALYLYQDVVDLYRAGDLSASEFCAIETILYDRIGDHDPNVLDETVFPERFQDYYIKDTYAGQTIWNGEGGNGEDRGVEPNTVSNHIWISPSIVNCSDDVGDYCPAHQRPIYNGPTNEDFIYVTVDDRGCTGSDLTGQLKVYVSLAATTHQWPTNWGGENGESPYYLRWTHGGFDHEELAGYMIGALDLSDPNNYALHDGKRIYKFPWVPFDTRLFKTYEPEDEYDNFGRHVCILARIVSDKDPMYDEREGGVGHNVRQNNNIAWKNTIVEFGSGFTGEDIHAALMLRPAMLHDEGGQSAMSVFSIDLNENEYIQTFQDFRNAGRLLIRFPANLVEQLNPAQAIGWQMDEAENTIEIISENFQLPLDLLADEDYVVAITFDPTINFVPVHFNLVQTSEEGCVVGGQEFTFFPEFNTTQGTNQEQYRLAANESEITLVPNPTVNSFELQNINYEEVNLVRIINAEGSLVKEFKKSETTLYSLTGLQPGIYFVDIQKVDGTRITKKIIVL